MKILGLGSFATAVSCAVSLLAGVGGSTATAAELEAPVLSIEAASAADESGRAAVFTVKLSAPAKPSTVVRVSTGAAEGADAATAGADYKPLNAVEVEIPKGERSAQVEVAVNDDALDEARERFVVTLSNATAAGGITIDPDNKTAAGWIDDNDAAPAATIADAADVPEGNSSGAEAQFTVSLSKKSGRDVRVEYGTRNGSAKSGEDYAAKEGVLRIAEGELSGTVTISVTGDTTAESNETFVVALSTYDATAAIGEPSVGTAKILDDDGTPAEPKPAPRVSIGDASVKEGNTGTTEVKLAVKLSAASTEPLVVRAVTHDGSAVAPGDYRSESGTVTFAPGTTERVIDVLVNGDTADEPNETFFVDVTVASGKADLADARAAVTIVDDDQPSGGGPVVNGLLSIADASAAEPEAGSATMTFTVTLAPTLGRVVTLNWATADGTAKAGSDYTAASGTISLAPGETTKVVSVTVLQDDEPEANETFFVNLSGTAGAGLADAQGMGTIVDRGARPSLSISDPLCQEGEGATFVVELTGTANSPVTVTFSTRDGTAREGVDYLARQATITFQPGETRKTISVTVVDDALAEGVETFSVGLGNPVNGVITKSRGVATIEASDRAEFGTAASTRPLTPLPLPVPVKSQPTTPGGARSGKATLLPRMVLGPLVVTVNDRGVARLTVACRRVSPVTCSGRIALETAVKPKVALGAKSFTVKKGKRAVVPLKLRKQGLALVRERGTMRVRVIVFVKVGKVMRRFLPGTITVQAPSAAQTAASASQP